MVGLYIAGALQKSKTLPNFIDSRVLRSIPIQEESKVFVEELVTELGSSGTDLMIKSALEETLSASAGPRPGRGFFSTAASCSLLLALASHAPPILRMWVRLWRALRRSPPSSIFDLFRFPRRASLANSHCPSAIQDACGVC